MKKGFLLLIVLGAQFLTSCSSETVKNHIKEYKIYLNAEKELRAKCPALKGTLMVKDSLVVGALHNSRGEGFTIRGGYKDESREMAVDIYNNKGEVVINAGGDLEAKGGKGDWTGLYCDGEWVAVRDK